MNPRKALRVVCLVSLLAMVLLQGRVIFTSLSEFSEPLYASFVSLNFGATFVAVCMVGTLLFDENCGNYNKISAVILSGMAIVISVDTWGLYCWKVLCEDRLTFIMLNIEYYLSTVALFLMVAALWEFVHPEPRKFKNALILAFIPVLFESVLLSQNLISNNLWSMDGGNIVHGTHYPLMFLAPATQEIMYILFSIRLSDDRKRGLMYASFMAFSLIGVVIMLPRYYSTVNYLMTLFPMMLVIPYEHKIRRQRLKKGQRDLKTAESAVTISQLNIKEIESSLIQIENMDCMDSNVSEALGKFRKFICDNYESFNEPSMIPFEKELGNTKAYIYLEKLRYKNKLSVEYRIHATDFKVPSLSMQILVENAIKHGIAKRYDGGRVTIAVDALKDHYRIIVEDDGVGFDVDAPRNTDRSHIGIDNLQRRLAEMADGELHIESTPEVGTVCTVLIPKKA